MSDVMTHLTYVCIKVRFANANAFSEAYRIIPHIQIQAIVYLIINLYNIMSNSTIKLTHGVPTAQTCAVLDSG